MRGRRANGGRLPEAALRRIRSLAQRASGKGALGRALDSALSRAPALIAERGIGMVGSRDQVVLPCIPTTMSTTFIHLSAALLLLSPTSHAQELEFFSPKECPAEYQQPYQPVGMVGDRFFSLDPTTYDPRSMEPVGGRLSAWSIKTFEREFRKVLALPNEGRDWFRVLAISCAPDGFRVYYEYPDDPPKWSIIAMAHLSAKGEVTGEHRTLARVENQGSHALRIRAKVDEGSGTTIILLGSDGMKGIRPDVQVLTVSHTGNVLLDQKISLGEGATWMIDDLSTDSSGNGYLAVTRGGGMDERKCAMPFIILNARTQRAEHHCLGEETDKYADPTRTYGPMFRDHTKGQRYFIRALHEPGKLSSRVKGVRVLTFKLDDAELLADRAYLIPANDPADADQQDMWKQSWAFGASFDTTGVVRLHGLYEGLASDRISGMLYTTFSAGGEGVHTDRCDWRRRAATLYPVGAHDPSDIYMVRIAGQDYVFCNEFPANIGKNCGALEDWPATGPGWVGKGSTPVYAALNGNMTFKRIDLPLTLKEKAPMRIRPFITFNDGAVLIAEDGLRSRFILARSASAPAGVPGQR